MPAETIDPTALYPRLIPTYAGHRDWVRANADAVYLALTLEPDPEVDYHLKAARAIARLVTQLHNTRS